VSVRRLGVFALRRYLKKVSLIMVNKIVFVCIALLAAVAVQSQTREEQIAERLKPVGEVQLAGAAGGATGPQSPEKVYETYCTLCHASGVGNAPILGDVDAWSARIAKGKDALYASGLNGLGALMPAKGTCASCSEDDIKATVDYMVEKSQ